MTILIYILIALSVIPKDATNGPLCYRHYANPIIWGPPCAGIQLFNGSGVIIVNKLPLTYIAVKSGDVLTVFVKTIGDSIIVRSPMVLKSTQLIWSPKFTSGLMVMVIKINLSYFIYSNISWYVENRYLNIPLLKDFHPNLDINLTFMQFTMVF